MFNSTHGSLDRIAVSGFWSRLPSWEAVAAKVQATSWAPKALPFGGRTIRISEHLRLFPLGLRGGHRARYHAAGRGLSEAEHVQQDQAAATWSACAAAQRRALCLVLSLDSVSEGRRCHA